MNRLRTGAIAVAAGLATSAAVAGPALASTSVTSAIKAQDRAVNGSKVVAQLQHVHATTPAQVRKLDTSLKLLAGKFDHAATVVSTASATTSAQKTGQRDWVTGAREVGRGLDQFGTALGDVLHHDKAGARTELTRAEKTIAAGTKLGAMGDRLLGLPTRD